MTYWKINISMRVFLFYIFIMKYGKILSILNNISWCKKYIYMRFFITACISLCAFLKVHQSSEAKRGKIPPQKKEKKKKCQYLILKVVTWLNAFEYFSLLSLFLFFPLFENLGGHNQWMELPSSPPPRIK